MLGLNGPLFDKEEDKAGGEEGEPEHDVKRDHEASEVQCSLIVHLVSEGSG